MKEEKNVSWPFFFAEKIINGMLSIENIFVILIEYLLVICPYEQFALTEVAGEGGTDWAPQILVIGNIKKLDWGPYSDLWWLF